MAAELPKWRRRLGAGSTYERFMENRLRRALELEGVPIRLRFRPGRRR